jgi:hypothetical protein
VRFRLVCILLAGLLKNIAAQLELVSLMPAIYKLTAQDGSEKLYHDPACVIGEITAWLKHADKLLENLFSPVPITPCFFAGPIKVTLRKP